LNDKKAALISEITGTDIKQFSYENK